MFSGIARVFVTVSCVIALVFQPASAGLDCALTPDHADCVGREMLVSPSGYVYGTCRDGWTLFDNRDNSELNPSCYAMIDYTFGGAYATFDDACAAALPGSHALSIRSRKKATARGINLLSRIVNSLDTEPYAAIGCSQDPNSPTGEGKTGEGWAWSDGTPSSNLVCPDPSSNRCEGTFVWGAGFYQYTSDGNAGSGSAASGSQAASGSAASGSGSVDLTGPFSREPTYVCCLFTVQLSWLV
jgi:hypothetical protein